jgi:hypothetical protein
VRSICTSLKLSKWQQGTASQELRTGPDNGFVSEKIVDITQCMLLVIGLHICNIHLPKNLEGILDHIYARAIVIDNGKTIAALVVAFQTAAKEQL